MEELIEAVKALGVPTSLDYAPVILSVIAVAVGIYFPIRIAKKQNQIAIFEKLYTAYSQLLLLKNFASLIRDYSLVGDPNEVYRIHSLICVHFETCFQYCPNIDNYSDSIGPTIAALKIKETQAHMLPLLIAKKEKQQKQYEEKISAIFEPLYFLINELFFFDSDNNEKANDHLKEFVEATDAFFDEYSEKIESALRCR